MREVVLLGAAILASYLGFALLALSQRKHWAHVTNTAAPARGSVIVLRVLGYAAIGSTLVLTVLRDGPAFGSVLWALMLTVSAVAVAFTLTWRPSWLHLAARVAVPTALALLLVQPAFAHIRVYPQESTAGAREKYVVRVPNEKQVKVTRIEGEFPAGLEVYAFEFKPGWTVTMRKNAQGKITGATWTGSMAPNEFVEFGILAINPQKAGNVTWTFVQVYEDGTREEFTGPVGSNLPAPVVTLKSASTAR